MPVLAAATAAVLLIAPASAASSWPRALYGLNVVWGESGSSFGADFAGKCTEMARLAREAGCAHTKVGIAWRDVEARRGTYDWAYSDKVIDFIHGQGLTLVAVLACAPDWAIELTDEEAALFRDRGAENLITVLTPKRRYEAEYRRFCTEAARRYAGVVDLYEFWNEPDGMAGPVIMYDAGGRPHNIRFGGDPVEFSWWQRVTYEAVKEGNPAAVVAIGGLVEQPSVRFLKGMYAAGARGSFDAVAIHPYSGLDCAVSYWWIEDMRRVMVDNGDWALPFWATEYGWGAATPDEQRLQADAVRRALSVFRSKPYVTMAFHHTLNDWRGREDNPESVIPMGLCTYDLSPKPAYEAFAAEALGGRSGPLDVSVRRAPWWVMPGEAREVSATVKATGPAQRVLRLRRIGLSAPDGWQVSGGPSAPQLLPPGRSATYSWSVTAPMSAVGRDSVELTLTLSVDDSGDESLVSVPIYLECVPPLLAAWASPGVAEPASAGVPLRLPLEVAGKSPQRLDVSVRPSGDGIAPGGAVALELEPGATATAVVSPGFGEVGEGCTLGLWADVVVGGASVARLLRPVCPRPIELQPAAEVPAIDGDLGDAPGVAYRFVLADGDVRGAVAVAGGGLYIALEVADADHEQSETASDTWRGDSVQVGLDALRDARADAGYDHNDYEYCVALTDRGPETFVHRNGSGGPTGLSRSVDLAVLAEGGRTVYEIYLPAPAVAPLDLSASSDAAFGLSVLVNDADGGERETHEWGGGIADHKDPARFMGMRLSKRR